MLNILILEDLPELYERIAFLLESVPGVAIQQAANRAEAEASILIAERPFDLMIIDYRLAPLSTLSELQKLAQEIECVFYVQSPKSELPPLGWKVFATLERKLIAETLLDIVETWTKKRFGLHDFLPDADKYCRIKTSLLIDVSPLNSDIYVKLSSAKYLKVFRVGDVFDQDDLRKYTEQKKIEYLYLLKENCNEFIQKYILFIGHLLKEAKPISIIELAYMHTSIQESVQELSDKIGFTEEVQNLARTQVELTVKSMGKKPMLKILLQRLEGQRGKYLADHSFLTGYIACAIAGQLEWSSESTFTKLTLAAFMHDIVLTDELAHCETIAEAAALGTDEKSLNNYTRHPYRTAELIRAMTEIPPDVDAIVFQHHELPDGSGFPRGITSNHLSPLSAVFLVAHDMAKTYLYERELFTVEGFTASIQSKYSQNSFRKIIAALSALTDNLITRPT